MNENRKFSDFKIKSILFLFLFFCIFPFIYIAQYNLPLSDEFACMYYRISHSFWEYQKILFGTWSGRYIANLLEIIYPVNVYYPFYQIFPVFLFILFYLSLLLISKKIVSKNYQTFAIVLFLLMINYFPSTAEIFYYVPAIIIYTISFFSILLLIAVWLSEINIKYKIIALIINNIILLGTTELYIPLVVYFSFILLINSISEKKLVSFYVINQLVILIILLYLFTERGNLNRYQIQKIELNLFTCSYNYLYSIFYWSKKFLFLLPFILFTVFILKKDEKILALSKKITRNHIIIMVTGYFVLFTPLFFINLTNYVRTANVFFIYFLIMLFLISIKAITELNCILKKISSLLFIPVIILFLFTGNIKRAYNDLYHGYTKDMSKTLKARYKYLEENRNSSYIHLDKVQKTDYLLMIQDVNDRNDNNLADDMYKMYYNIDSLKIE